MSSMDLIWYRNNLGSLEIYDCMFKKLKNDCSMFMLDHINVTNMNDPKVHVHGKGYLFIPGCVCRTI